MRHFAGARHISTPDELWIVEHPPVYTLGQAGNPVHLIEPHPSIPLVQTDRGGQITFHGPGQVIIYVLVDLRRRRLMVRTLVNRIEQAVIDTLLHYGLNGIRHPGAPGIYIHDTPAHPDQQDAKIAALGLKIQRGCSYHGVSLNVNMDLQPFTHINPCGYPGLQTTDMATMGVTVSQDTVAHTLARQLTHQLNAPV